MRVEVRDSEAVFLVRLGTSSFLARHELSRKATENLVPSWEHARSKPDKKYDLWSTLKKPYFFQD